jgi:hypothetical protein
MSNNDYDNSSPENWAKWLKDVDLDLKEEETSPEIERVPDSLSVLEPEPEPQTFAEIEIPIEEEAPLPAHEELHGGHEEEEWERIEREKQEFLLAAVARERARQAVLAARPWYLKLAAGTGALLGPYSQGFRGWTGDPVFEEKINTGFGFILLFLIALLPIIGIGALFASYPVAMLILLLVLFLGVVGYLSARNS